MADNNRLDTMIEMMRASAPEGHRIHTADIADLRIAEGEPDLAHFLRAEAAQDVVHVRA